MNSLTIDDLATAERGDNFRRAVTQPLKGHGQR
jgi:hypothetical protein